MTPPPATTRSTPGSRIVARVKLAWRNDVLRLIVLTLYYLAIMVALIAIYGTQRYSPPPFIYQGF